MNITEILEEYGIAYESAGHRHVREGWIGVDCPHCSPDSGKFKLGFEINSGRTNCWTCGAFDLAEIIAEVCRVSKGLAINLIGDRHRVYSPRKQHIGTLKVPATCDLLGAHERYLKNRGFDPAELQRIWGIRGIGPVGNLRWRIFIPIHDERGRIVSWTTRTIGDSGLRYISAAPEEETTPHKELLYGHHLARHSIVIQEGPTDTWAIGPGSVSTLGIVYSPTQMALMGSFPRRAVCFDNEPAARRRAEKLCRDLSVMSGITELVVIESGKDAAEADAAEILEIRNRYLN